jgi:hypothetical protein
MDQKLVGLSVLVYDVKVTFLEVDIAFLLTLALSLRLGLVVFNEGDLFKASHFVSSKENTGSTGVGDEWVSLSVLMNVVNSSIDAHLGLGLSEMD